MILHVIITSVLWTAAIALLIIFSIRLRKFKRNIEVIRSKVNHDLRSPLNAIMGFSDLLLQTETDEEKRKFLSAVKSGGETMLSTIEDVAVVIRDNLDSSDAPASAAAAVNSDLKSINSLDNNSEALILIVDDMIENVVFLEKILQKSGFRTISAMSGDSALDLMTEHTPDLILLDIVMPGMSGFETCARIQNNRDFIDIPVIFLSAKKDEKTIIESFIYGGIDYVVKPFNSPELLARVNTHLQLKNAKEKLHTLAFTDALTGLYNRRKFLETLDQERARAFRYNENLSLIMIDIDHFKSINDQFGHDTGDRALEKFAEIVEHSLRETDFAGRLGGEEFGILLPQTNGTQARVVAERIRAKIETETAAEKDLPGFTASFGIAEFHENQNNASLLTQEADKALYRAKEGGRNRVCIAKEGNE